MVSDGNMSLMRAVEKFDFALGNAFGTYAAWAIVNGFARATLTSSAAASVSGPTTSRRFLTAAATMMSPGRSGRVVGVGPGGLHSEEP